MYITLTKRCAPPSGAVRRMGTGQDRSLVTLYSSKVSIDVRQTHIDAASAGLQVIVEQTTDTSN